MIKVKHMFNFDSNSIDPTSMIPLYNQVANVITEEIDMGNIAAGEKLPSELLLMKVFNVSRVTIRGAILELVSDGLLIRSQGKGTFVAPKKKLQSANDTTGLTESCRRLGKELHSQVLSAGYSYATKAECDFLKIDESEQIIEVVRLRFIDRRPTVIETSHFLKKYDFLLHENLEGSIFECFNKHGISVHTSQRTLEISTATAYEAELLETKRNSSLLLFRDFQSGGFDTPLFVAKQLYNTQDMVFYL